MIAIAFLVLGYLIGSLSAAIIVARLRGLGDPRDVGSGNPGATNILRAYGKGAAAATLAGDLLKGLIPVLLVRVLLGNDQWVALTALGAFLGHLFPVYFGFRGGKGVATYVGVLLAIAWPLGAAFAGSWIVVAALTRYSSAAALVAAALSPVLAWWWDFDKFIIAVMILMVCLLFWRHSTNISKLMKGEESKIGGSRKS